VSANCTISAGALAFGAYDPVSANASSPKDGTATLTVTCTSGSTGNITLDQGDNANTGSTDAVPLRRMINGSNHLAYYLYQDSERTTVWGNTTATDVAHLGTGSSASVTVYGQIPGGQNVPAAAYTDTVTATITF
jgi:spore coat protein U-like protein